MSLLPHNEPVYENLINVVNKDKKNVCVVMGTGVGKSYVTLEYIRSFGLRPLIVTPRNEICKSWKKLIPECDTITYQKLVRIYKEIDFSAYDVVICDEVHHIGAETWGKPIKYLIDDGIIRVIGLTEDPVRWTDGARNVCDEFFNGNIIRGKDVSSAISEGILNPVTYIGAFYSSDGLRDTLRGKIQERLYAKLDLVLNQTPTVSEILRSNMPSGDRKGIIFAQTIEDMDDAIDFVHSVFPDVEIRRVYSKQSNVINNRNFEWFKSVDSGYLCSVDMISEGVHIKGVNTLIMLRRTQSLNLFNQQLGRCLDASKNAGAAIVFDLVNNKGNVRVVNGKVRIKIGSVFQNSVFESSPSSQKIIKDFSKDLVDVLVEIKESFNNNVEWPEEDDNVLYTYWGKEPRADTILRLSIKRTLDVARKRAKVLGLTEYQNHEDWTEKEDALVRKHYRNKKLITKLLPNRKYTTILSRASAIGATTKKKDYISWPEEDDKTMREYYPKEGYLVADRLIVKREVWSIKRRARDLGLKCNKKHNLRPVRCIETGIIYPSLSAACKAMGKYIHMGRGASCGYHWEYVK